MKIKKYLPFFSIIVPVYNVESYLRECVESVLSQSIDDYELILIDDGSTDNSADICKEYEMNYGNVRFIKKKNSGAAAARNDGIKIAQGKYLLFLDSDDFWCTKDCLKILKKNTENSPDFILFKMNKYYGDSMKDSYGDYDMKIIGNSSPENILLYMVKENKPLACACNKAVEREYIIENNIFFREGITGEDIDWSIRLFKNAKKNCVINNVLYMYRQNRAGSVTNKVTTKKLKDLYNTIKSVADEYKEGNTLFDNAVKSFMAYEYAILLYNFPLCVSDVSLSDIKEYKWLLKYAIDKKTKAIKFIYGIFGCNMANKIIKVIREIR